MPDRIVRAGILTSDPVNTLSWPAEVLYRRLHSIVDDYGRYDGRSSLLRAHLYPLKIDKVSEADVGKWLTECVTAGLVSLYRVAGRPYVEVTKFGARVRAETSKWPSPDDADKQAPSSADIRARPHANAAVVVFDVVDEGVVVVAPRKSAASTAKPAKPGPIPDDFGISDRVASWAKDKGYDRLDEHCEAFIRKCKAKAYKYADFDLAFMEAVREDWAKLRGRGINGAAPPAGNLANAEEARRAATTEEARARVFGLKETTNA